MRCTDNSHGAVIWWRLTLANSDAGGGRWWRLERYLIRFMVTRRGRVRNSNAASARRTCGHSRGPTPKSHHINTNPRHKQQRDPHLCIRTALELREHVGFGSQSNPNRNAHTRPGSTKRETYWMFTNQRTHNGVKEKKIITYRLQLPATRFRNARQLRRRKEPCFSNLQT